MVQLPHATLQWKLTRKKFQKSAAEKENSLYELFFYVENTLFSVFNERERFLESWVTRKKLLSNSENAS